MALSKASRYCAECALLCRDSSRMRSHETLRDLGSLSLVGSEIVGNLTLPIKVRNQGTQSERWPYLRNSCMHELGGIARVGGQFIIRYCSASLRFQLWKKKREKKKATKRTELPRYSVNGYYPCRFQCN